MKKFPFRLGTTSYIIPDDIVPNVRYLADFVDDIELVLFEVDDGPNNLPDASTIAELNRLALHYDLSYTIHLPLDLRLTGADGQRHTSLVKAKRVIDVTRDLHPWAYVCHMEGRELLPEVLPAAKQTWDEQALGAISTAAEWSAGAQFLAVENLERYPLDFLDALVAHSAVSRCIDIGHLWLDQHDPVAYLQKHIQRARVLHIHGIGERDHQSLEHVSTQEIQRVLAAVLQANFAGVMTIEVFSQADFHSSLSVLERVVRDQ